MRLSFELRIALYVVVMCVVPYVPLCAGDRAATESELASLQDAVGDFASAVARGDADAVRNLWATDGDFIDATGKRHSVDEFIRQIVPKQRDDSANGSNKSRESTIRFVVPDVAIEDGTYEFVDSREDQPKLRRFTAVWVQSDNQWLLHSRRESTVKQVAAAGRLQPLAFLLGEWIGEMDDYVILISARLSDGGNFIIRDFAMLGDVAHTTATERIGYDAVTGEIKSWTFDSQDGRSEATWKTDGNHWTVVTDEVLADGKMATTTSTIAPGDSNQFTWKATKSTIGDRSVPTHRIEFKRAPEDQ